MNWSTQKKKEGNFGAVYFEIFLTSMFYLIQITLSFTYEKTFHTLFCFFKKSLKAFSVSLINSIKFPLP